MAKFLLLILYVIGVGLISLLILFLPCLFYFNARQKKREMLIRQITKFEIKHHFFGEKMLIAIDQDFSQICLIELSQIPKGEEKSAERYFNYFTAEEIFQTKLFQDTLNIEIQLSVINKERAIYYIDFFNLSPNVDFRKFADTYQRCLKEARTWQGYFQIMKQNVPTKFITK